MERYILLPFWFIFGVIGISHSQSTAWFALTDYSHLMVPFEIKADSDGNTFVLGEFEKESRFSSADSNDLEVHATAYFREVFLAKYDPDGRLIYVNFIEQSGGSSNSVSSGSLLVLGDGRLAVVFTSVSGVRIHTTDGVQDKQMRSSSGLCFFDAKGNLEQVIDLPLSYSRFIAKNSSGDIFILGRGSGHYASYSTEYLFMIRRGQTEVTKLTHEFTALSDIRMVNDKIWIAYYEFQEKKYYSRRGTFHFKLIDTYNPDIMVSKFSKATGFMEDPKVSFLESGGKLQISVLIEGRSNGTVEFDGKNVQLEKGRNVLMIYDQNGHQIKTTRNGGFARNTFINGTSDGGYLMTTLAYDTLFLSGRDPIVCLRDAMWEYELFHIKFDNQLRIQWVTKGGGATTHYMHSCALDVVKDQLYVASRLYGYGEFDFGRRDLNWSGGMYVRNISMSE